MNELKHLFSPASIGTMELRNRIVMAPMATDFADDDGKVSQRLTDYLAARAEGGVGLIILEATTIDETFPYMPRSVGLWDDRLIPGMRGLVDAVHAHGAKLAPQIVHPGPKSLSTIINGTQTVGPTAGIVNNITKRRCRELAAGEIREICRQFGRAAARAREAGCDGMELHAAHGYMLAGSFLSPLRNRRADAYGGSLQGRLKFILEVMENIRDGAGDDFPVIVRISGAELVPGGMDVREMQTIGSILAGAGVDDFHVSSGVYPDLSWRVIPPTGTPLCLNAGLSEAIRKAVDVPVMVVGRINDPLMAEGVLARQEADLVVMGRALLADPELPNKARAGRLYDIAPCMGCGQGCVAAREKGADMTCVVNPAVGREREMALIPAERKKKVLVAGGGPAGLEAARTAALRGHDVTLVERADRVGGQYNLAAAAPSKQELTSVIRYLAHQAEKAGVKIELETTVTPGLVEKMAPDAVVVATGGEACRPDLPGADRDEVVCAHDVLSGGVDAAAAGNVLIIGGGMTGCDIAELLADRGDDITIGRRAVTIVEMREDIAPDMFSQKRVLVMEALRRKDVTIMTSATVREILEDGALIEKGGKQQAIRGMDLVILATGVRCVDTLSKVIDNGNREVYTIGDAREPRQALEAICEGAEIGRKL
ncbi:MAG: FAD-dependent oxidoreductase [Pseudomonadota bacterium]